MFQILKNKHAAEQNQKLQGATSLEWDCGEKNMWVRELLFLIVSPPVLGDRFSIKMNHFHLNNE